LPQTPLEKLTKPLAVFKGATSKGREKEEGEEGGEGKGRKGRGQHPEIFWPRTAHDRIRKKKKKTLFCRSRSHGKV